MSFQYTGRVWEQSKQKGTTRLMLLAIADSATKDIGIAWPGLGTLAKMMGPRYSRRAAGQRIEALAISRELAVFPRKGASHDYIVLLGMTRTEIKRAYKALAIRRRVTIGDLIDLRRSFATQAAIKSSQVPAGKSSQGVRRNPVTIRKEPLSEPVVVTTTTKKSIFDVWEQEARTLLSPILGEELGDMVDTFGEPMVADAIREAVKATGPGLFNVKYVLRICERWKREGRIERKPAGNGSERPASSPHPPYVIPEPSPSVADSPNAVAILEAARLQVEKNKREAAAAKNGGKR